ncbi:single-stranded-DNA-specific exonuclease RecJ, partial [Lactobacillus sp. XV13L]|nr:single-stranded-DNA-specific exonuclease RecJ [Lactobacillus sp. XV13L]
VNTFGVDPEKIALVSEYDGNDEVAVLLDVPRNQRELDLALQNGYRQLYLRFLIDRLPVQSLPAQSQFAKVLRYVYLHRGLAIEDYRPVAAFLGMDYNSLLFIMRVFFELKFIKVEQGKIFGVSNPVKQPLASSRYFKAARSQIHFVQALRHASSTKLLAYVEQQLKRH